ncbi:hypothetical protein HRbin03_00184 [archaeon HR03]|nr:hypothetical protein HRbin03_00184 [archaeon HR03]
MTSLVISQSFGVWSPRYPTKPLDSSSLRRNLRGDILQPPISMSSDDAKPMSASFFTKIRPGLPSIQSHSLKPLSWKLRGKVANSECMVTYVSRGPTGCGNSTLSIKLSGGIDTSWPLRRTTASSVISSKSVSGDHVKRGGFSVRSTEPSLM